MFLLIPSDDEDFLISTDQIILVEAEAPHRTRIDLRGGVTVRTRIPLDRLHYVLSAPDNYAGNNRLEAWLRTNP